MVVTTRSPIERLIEYKEQRGFANLSYVSDTSGEYTRTYVNSENADVPGFSVFSRHVGIIRNFYSGEMGAPGKGTSMKLSESAIGPYTIDVPESIPLLTDPASFGGHAEDTFDVVVPDIPGICRDNKPGSGTGDLSGLRGEGGFEGEFGKGSEGTLDYWFE